jgi:hypothetical protein
LAYEETGVGVLPRYRLLRTPGGFEGLLTIPIRLEAHDQPGSDSELMGRPDIDANPALLARRADPNERQDPFVVHVEEALLSGYASVKSNSTSGAARSEAVPIRPRGSA